MTEDTTTGPAPRGRLAAVGPVPLLAALLAVDLALIAASVVRLVTAGPDLTDPWLLETDGGWAEVVGYAHQAVLGLLLLALCLLTRHLVWAAYAALFLLALADDSLRLHENRGAWLADRLAARLWFPPDGFLGLRASDLGELLLWALLAAAPLLAAVLLHRRADGWDRRASRGMAVLVAAYVFCGAVLDQVHVLFLDSWVGDVVGTVEDGGELVVLSASVGYVAGRLADRRRARAAGGPGAGRSAATPVPVRG
ncbi:hypothetical protein SAMN06893096_10782 [Geodermatophilus pulveris]|uniref:Uncharacterized protein n=1 Tax=Geodermatophilus pulveris TaxID=1564159 RepID=A0A239GVQ2_9ACTN|nr:hypothetical protein [Geodermatophilus pulveris]SNS73210.1 hypothetical protein SAMN06893096_10782 [Geodermatophilus pulveris]